VFITFVVVIVVVGCLFQFHIRQYRKGILNISFDNSALGMFIADYVFHRHDTPLYKTKNTARDQVAREIFMTIIKNYISDKIRAQMIVIQCIFKIKCVLSKQKGITLYI
jgi:hypothetical protein